MAPQGSLTFIHFVVLIASTREDEVWTFINSRDFSTNHTDNLKESLSSNWLQWVVMYGVKVIDFNNHSLQSTTSFSITLETHSGLAQNFIYRPEHYLIPIS